MSYPVPKVLHTSELLPVDVHAASPGAQTFGDTVIAIDELPDDGNVLASAMM